MLASIKPHNQHLKYHLIKFHNYSRLWAHEKKKLATVTAHRDLTVTKMVTASRDWAVTWAVIELWPRRDWAVTSPSRDWAVIIGPRSRDHRGHRALTVSSRWPFIFSWEVLTN